MNNKQTTSAMIETKILNNVEVQQNGIIRNSEGRLIARLVDDIEFNSEHINQVFKPFTTETVSEDKRNFARVRRSSDNAELDFTWQDIIKGKVLNWVNKNGTADGFVSIEYNPSGNGNDIVHTTVVHQPRLVTSGVLNTENGKPALEKAYETHNYGCQYSSSCTGTNETTLQEKFEREFGIHFKDKGELGFATEFIKEEIALAVQQRDGEIIEIVKKMHGEHHEYINNSTIGLNAYRQAVIDIIKSINSKNL